MRGSVVFKRETGSDMGALRDETALNVRGWGGRRVSREVRPNPDFAVISGVNMHRNVHTPGAEWLR